MVGAGIAGMVGVVMVWLAVAARGWDTTVPPGDQPTIDALAEVGVVAEAGGALSAALAEAWAVAPTAVSETTVPSAAATAEDAAEHRGVPVRSFGLAPGRVRRSKTIPALLGVVLVSSAMSGQPNVARLSASTRGGKGPSTLVLLHGYCSSEKDWLPLVTQILPSNGIRVILPRGPESAKRTDGGPPGRAWWQMNLAAGMRPGRLGADLSAEKPAGIEDAAQAVRRLLARRGNRTAQPFILGGFSQGAMVAAQVAFLSDEPLAALVLLSGSLVNEASWKANFVRRKGLRVFIAHGRADPTLSFETADRMRGEMAAAGMDVVWLPFDGGHETPSDVVVALKEFLLRVSSGPNSFRRNERDRTSY